MPRYVIRRSPEVAEYLLWSTVTDGPASGVLTRDEVAAVLASGLPVDRDLAVEQARRDLDRVDRQGSSERDAVAFGYDCDRFWWREHAPSDFGAPYEVGDRPGMVIGRVGTRGDLFRVCRQPRPATADGGR